MSLAFDYPEVIRTATWICAAATFGASLATFTKVLVKAHRWAMAALAFWSIAIWWGMVKNLHVPVKGTTWLLLAGGICGVMFFVRTFSFRTGQRRPAKLTRAGREAKEQEASDQNRD